MDDLIEFLPDLWHILFKLLDDIKVGVTFRPGTVSNSPSLAETCLLGVVFSNE